MTVFALLFLYWALSGLTLAIYDFNDPSQGWAEGGGPGARPVHFSVSSPLLAADLEPAIRAAMAQASSQAAGDAITALEVRRTASGVQAIADIAGSQPRRLTLDMRDGSRQLTLVETARTGAPGAMPEGPGGARPPPDLHTRLKNWHRGNIVGTWGVGVAMLTGIALICMILTGTLLYLSLWSRRRALQRPKFFWT